MPKHGNSSTQRDQHPDRSFGVENAMIPRFGAVPFELVDSDEYRALKGRARHVLTVLLLFADRGLESWPSQRTIAAIVGTNREVVNKSIRQLCTAKLLVKRFDQERQRIIYTVVRPPSKRR